MDTSNISQGVEKANSLDYSKTEALVNNITIPGSAFHAKWVKDEGYAIGIENIKITRSYKTLEEALNKIGYGADKDSEGDDLLMKVGEIDYELIVRIIKALMIIEEIKVRDYNEIGKPYKEQI